MTNEKLSIKLYNNLKDWYEKDGNATLLEKKRECLKAEIYNFHRLSKEKIGSKDAEMLALSSEEYQEHIDNMVKARTEANISRAKSEATRVLIEEQKMLDMKNMQQIKYSNGAGG